MNKPYLFFAEHFFAIHQVDIMYSEYHLCIGIQFIIKHGNYRSGQFKVNAAVQFVHDKNSALFYLVDSSKFQQMAEMKRIVTAFASRIDIVNMNNIPLKRTINLMKNQNDLQRKVVEFIKNSDLYMDDFEYVDMENIRVKMDSDEEKPEEKALDIPEQIMDQIRLVSVYRGVAVPSVLFDSTGTKKIAALKRML